VLLNANPYLYPIVVSGIIFLAVLLDSQRTRLLDQLTRRQIRIEPHPSGSSDHSETAAANRSTG
jgi:ribose transport system permease protein